MSRDMVDDERMQGVAALGSAGCGCLASTVCIVILVLAFYWIGLGNIADFLLGIVTGILCALWEEFPGVCIAAVMIPILIGGLIFACDAYYRNNRKKQKNARKQKINRENDCALNKPDGEPRKHEEPDCEAYGCDGVWE